MPRAARFCPECGRPTGADGEPTAIEEVPPHETGPVPVHAFAVEPRWFGVTPATSILVLASAALGAAVFLLVDGQILAGGLLLAAAAVLVALFLAAARTRPDSGVARASAGAVGALRARAGFAVEAVAAQGSARVEFFRLRRAVDLAAQRGQALQVLGDAVYREDEDAANEARGALRALDGEISQREGRMQTIVEHAQERVRRARLEVQQTEIRAFDPPGPAPVPEPGPVPSPPVEPPRSRSRRPSRRRRWSRR